MKKYIAAWLTAGVILGSALGLAQQGGDPPQDPDSYGAYVQEPPEYPAGVSCSPAGAMSGGKVIDADHPCSCKNMGDPKESCEKPITNDPVCKQYCHEKHCSCPLMCDMKGMK